MNHIITGSRGLISYEILSDLSGTSGQTLHAGMRDPHSKHVVLKKKIETQSHT